jgi:hypothetical protein
MPITAEKVWRALKEKERAAGEEAVEAATPAGVTA